MTKLVTSLSCGSVARASGVTTDLEQVPVTNSYVIMIMIIYMYNNDGDDGGGHSDGDTDDDIDDEKHINSSF